MKKFAFVLGLLFVATSAMAADAPVAFSPAGSGHNYVPGTREVCWSNPADLNDAKISSEIIGAFGLETELVNDFMLAADATVTGTIGYGGYYNWIQGDPDITAINWKFYDDGGCVPINLLDTFVGLGTRTYIGMDIYGWPTYKYDNTGGVSFAAQANNLYWLGVQAADHAFPPQWGGQGTGGIVTNCDTLFKSVYFGYPNWTPAGDLVGAPFDLAFELICGQPTATESTTWGAIKSLYR